MIITAHQTAGRGQRGNTWEAAPGENLTFSVVLTPTFLRVSDQFQLNIITALAIRDALQAYTTQAVRIKWPNDILVGDRKICGILIENQLQGQRFQHVVAGIGLNVNQLRFSLPTATSLALVTGQTYDLPRVWEDILQHLETRYLQLRQGAAGALRADYLRHLYGMGEVRAFEAAGKPFDGTITGIDDAGRLCVQTTHGLRTFGLKEISFVRP